MVRRGTGVPHRQETLPREAGKCPPNAISFMRKPDAKGVGYCRVSTEGQTLDAQIGELKAAGATKLFAEKQSGARSDRPHLRKAIAALGEGDVLMVTRLDRLARSTRDLLGHQIWPTE
jgi:hypothetical protein